MVKLEKTARHPTHWCHMQHEWRHSSSSGSGSRAPGAPVTDVGSSSVSATATAHRDRPSTSLARAQPLEERRPDGGQEEDDELHDVEGHQRDEEGAEDAEAGRS